MTTDARICILGPIPSEKDFGGVAVFDAALGKAFTQLGYDVVWCTKQNFPKGEFVNNIYTISLFNIRKVISAAKPTIIIASLDYAKYFFLLKHRCIKIHYLHGFFNVAHYGLLKYNLCWLYQKIISKNAIRFIQTAIIQKL